MCVCVVKKEVGFLLAVQPQEVGSLTLNRAARISSIRGKEQGSETGWSKGSGNLSRPLSPCVPLDTFKTLIYLFQAL